MQAFICEGQPEKVEIVDGNLPLPGTDTGSAASPRIITPPADPCTPDAQPVKAQKTLPIQADNIIEYREYSLQSRLPFGPFQRNALDHIVLTNVVFYQSHQRDR